MKDIADTPPTKRSRQRRAKRRPRMRWGRLFVCLVIFAVIAVAGLASGTIVAISHNLPNIDAMKPVQLGQDTVIYDSNGHRIAELYGAVNRLIVPSAQISEVMKNATVAVEDKRFYQHHGVDFTGIARAFVDDVRAGHVVSGASTLTEQYVKNAYLGDDVTISRKLREAVLAWELEDRWSKDKILTEYLNTVYYGAGAYGVQAASLTYFHKPISKVSLAQAALLAALPKFPSEYSPITDPGVIKARRDLVLSDMAEQGYITTAQATAAESKPIEVFSKPLSTTNDPAAYFVDYVTRLLVNRYGARETFEGGLKVYTTIDMNMQHDAIAALKARLPSGGYAGALAAVDPANGFIRAMAASTDYKTYKYNLTWQAMRQPGSTMKPFALLAAVEDGANPASTFYNSHPLHIYLGPGADPPYWDVYTAEKSSGGRMNLVQATLASDNTVFAQLCLDLGPDKVVQVAKAMGITTKLIAEPSVVLGSEDVNVLEMANAYATFADEGVRHTPQAIAKVVFPNGKVSKARVRGVRGRRPAPATSSTRSSSRTRATRAGRRPPCPTTTRAARPARPAPRRTTGTPGSAASTPGSPRLCGWATHRAPSPCPACSAPPTRCRSGAPSTTRSSARPTSPTSPCPASCRSGSRGRARTRRWRPRRRPRRRRRPRDRARASPSHSRPRPSRPNRRPRRHPPRRRLRPSPRPKRATPASQACLGRLSMTRTALPSLRAIVRGSLSLP